MPNETNQGGEQGLGQENVAIVVDAMPTELAPRRNVNPHIESVLVYLASLHTAAGRKTALGALRRIARVLGLDSEGKDRNCWQRVPWCKLDARETTFIQAKIEASGAAPNTTKLTMTILRQVHWHAFRLEHMTGDAYARAKTVKVTGKRAPTGREIKREEIEAVCKAIGRRESPFREMCAAAWGLGIFCGLRREEFIRLKTSSLRENGTVLHVIGKGRKERQQEVSTRVRGVLWAWLHVREKLGLTTDALFPRWRDGKVQDEPASLDSMWRFLKQLQDGSGVEPFKPHDMRRTFCTSNLRKKRDIRVLQSLMGHEDPGTTLKYDRREEEELKRLKREALDDMDVEWGDALEAASTGGRASKEPRETTEAFGQTLVKAPKRRFERAGAPYDALKYAKTFLERGMTREQIAGALRKLGVTWAGRPVEARDL